MYHLIFKDKLHFVFIQMIKSANNVKNSENVFLPCTTWQPGTELRAPHQHHSEEHNPARRRSSPPGHCPSRFHPPTLFNNTAGECWSPALVPPSPVPQHLLYNRRSVKNQGDMMKWRPIESKWPFIDCWRDLWDFLGEFPRLVSIKLGRILVVILRLLLGFSHGVFF